MTRTKNNDLQIALSYATSALELIASPIRPDGTYNRCRAACEKIALDALAQVQLALIQEVDAQDMPITDDASFIPVRHSGKLTIYTDGGCKGNPGPAGWGAVVTDEDGFVLRESCGFIGVATNQVAELEAAIAGLSQACEGSVIELVSNSQYGLKGLSEWRASWERRGFVGVRGRQGRSADRRRKD